MDEFAKSAIARCIEYDSRIAPRSPRRAGIGEQDATRRWVSTVVRHQPQAKILAPRHGKIAHRAVLDDGPGVRLLFAPDRSISPVQSCVIPRSFATFKLCRRHDGQIRVALTVRACAPNKDKRAAGRQSSVRPGLHAHRKLHEVPLGKLRDRSQRLEICRWGEFREHGAIRQTVFGVVRRNRYVHLAAEAEACHRHLERSHADTWRLNGQIIAAGLEEIQTNATLRIDGIGCRDRIERAAQAPHRVAEQKIHSTCVLKGIAQVRAFDPVTCKSSAQRRLMQLFVLFTKKLLHLDGRAGLVTQHRLGRRWHGTKCRLCIHCLRK